MERIEQVGKEVLAALAGKDGHARHHGKVCAADSLFPQGSLSSEESADMDVGAEEAAISSHVRQSRRRKHSSTALTPLPLPRTALPLSDEQTRLPCPICHGAGYVREDVPFGHPLFGKPQPCWCRLERKQAEQREELWRLSQLDAYATFQNATFKSFCIEVPGVLDAWRAAWQYAQRPDGWLVLMGGNGCGKTHLAVAIARQCLSDGVPVLFAIVPDLLSVLRSTYARESQTTYDEALGHYTQAHVLVLDDLGAEQSTAWAEGQLFQLLNYRYNRRLPTVITTNRFQFSGIEPRLRSRLYDRHLVKQIEMREAGDYRINGEGEVPS